MTTMRVCVPGKSTRCMKDGASGQGVGPGREPSSSSSSSSVSSLPEPESELGSSACIARRRCASTS